MKNKLEDPGRETREAFAENAAREEELMEALLKDIISKRRFKIIKLSQKVGDPSPFIKHLAPEELWLFKTLRDQLQEWESSLVDCTNNDPCF